MALLRAIGPFVGGNILAWSFANGLPFPVNYFFAFLICSLLALIPLLMTINLPLSLNKPKNEVTEENRNLMKGKIRSAKIS